MAQALRVDADALTQRFERLAFELLAAESSRPRDERAVAAHVDAGGPARAFELDPGRDELLVPEGDPSAALERWYRRQAKVEIAARLDAATARYGTGYTGLTIRGQRTRWASRSSSGGMSFNWRLLLAPPEVLDYVVEHEVAHIEVMDHSPRFWRLLASRAPGWREHAAWLKRYGSTLTL